MRCGTWDDIQIVEVRKHFRDIPRRNDLVKHPQKWEHVRCVGNVRIEKRRRFCTDIVNELINTKLTYNSKHDRRHVMNVKEQNYIVPSSRKSYAYGSRLTTTTASLHCVKKRREHCDFLKQNRSYVSFLIDHPASRRTPMTKPNRSKRDVERKDS